MIYLREGVIFGQTLQICTKQAGSVSLPVGGWGGGGAGNGRKWWERVFSSLILEVVFTLYSGEISGGS